MAELRLLRGEVTLVDDEDLGRISQFVWRRGCRGYAVRSTGNAKNGTYKTHYLHREISGTPAGLLTDHANRNRLDNRKQNLRIATGSQNRMNSESNSTKKTSKFKGVSWADHRSKWEVRIAIDQRWTYLGRYTDENAAARAYNEAAKKVYGEFARLNSI
jgi:hypothetical protein